VPGPGQLKKIARQIFDESFVEKTSALLAVRTVGPIWPMQSRS
jgi:hypothetical protein